LEICASRSRQTPCASELAKKQKSKKKHDLSLSSETMTLNSELVPKIVAVGHLGQRLFCNNANKLQFHVS